MKTIKCGEAIPGADKCQDCDKPLTLEEQHYYTIRCHDCEDAWSTRLAVWMAGGEDPELGAMFSTKQP